MLFASRRTVAMWGMSIVLLLMMIQLIASQRQGLPKQSKGCTPPEATRSIKRAEDNPQLAVGYEHIARFKLASRKNRYRFGEMVSLDLAMLSVAKSPVFFKELSASTVRLAAYGTDGTKIKIAEFVVHQSGVSSKMYNLLRPNTILVGSLNLLVGCREAAEVMESKGKFLADFGPDDSDSIVFNQNLFVSWGDGCLDVVDPGMYDIVAEVANEHVIESSCEPYIKTAVGKMSERLRIAVLK